ncbi:hypothetical protein [Yinghuangia seranimata]|uniref:hypothetical protein n=1 Tax=Yinghuangia seranimata TaxID=408067 RepID=UPI00248AB661|nr:hypothetical protein [Yinghuangia seranimata]MDI2128815.1 hypothetical protein [Yinghuangia seranimata]
MNDTVAVALITSLSTLIAGGLAGLVSWLLTGRQLRHAGELAQRERAEARSGRLREGRREAYERFLVRVDEAYRALDNSWTQAPLTEPADGFTARRAVDEALVRVQLEGPEPVAAAAHLVTRSVGDEFRKLRRLIADHQGEQRSAAAVDAALRTAVLEARRDTTEAFVTEARAALNAA